MTLAALPRCDRRRTAPIRIVFEITLALELNGIILNIQDAAIRAIRIGSCRAKQA
jgi:hypothetical protein